MSWISCWLSNANHSIWIFAVFVVTVEVLNLLILARVVKEMSGTQPAPGNHQIRLCIKTCAVMIPLLGVTWLFGIFSTFHKAFAYIFTIFSATQGFLIFLLHCVRNTQIKERLNRKFNAVFPATNWQRSDNKYAQFCKVMNQRNACIAPCLLYINTSVISDGRDW